MSLLVMKFGGAAMATIERFFEIATLIQTRLKNYSKILIVVSAMGKATDALLSMAETIHPNPPKREQDMLISVGERVSMALLAMALDRKGIQAMSFTGSQSGIITTNQHTEARIIEIRPERIQKALRKQKVVIVAGFQGVSLEKEITTLGRGGSDISAVALAAALHAAKVEFYKDVPGIGEKNPKVYPETKIYSYLSYTEALSIIGKGAEVLHDRCLKVAETYNIPLEIYPFYDPETLGTIIAKSPEEQQEGEVVQKEKVMHA